MPGGGPKSRSGGRLGHHRFMSTIGGRGGPGPARNIGCPSLHCTRHNSSSHSLRASLTLLTDKTGACGAAARSPHRAEWGGVGRPGPESDLGPPKNLGPDLASQSSDFEYDWSRRRFGILRIRTSCASRARCRQPRVRAGGHLRWTPMRSTEAVESANSQPKIWADSVSKSSDLGEHRAWDRRLRPRRAHIPVAQLIAQQSGGHRWTSGECLSGPPPRRPHEDSV